MATQPTGDLSEYPRPWFYRPEIYYGFFIFPTRVVDPYASLTLAQQRGIPGNISWRNRLVHDHRVGGAVGAVGAGRRRGQPVHLRPPACCSRWLHRYSGPPTGRNMARLPLRVRNHHRHRLLLRPATSRNKTRPMMMMIILKMKVKRKNPAAMHHVAAVDAGAAPSAGRRIQGRSARIASNGKLPPRTISTCRRRNHGAALRR